MNRPSHRRSPRDWAVDTAVFLFALIFGLAIFEDSVEPGSREFVILLDLILGLALCIAIWFRRRWPVQLALIASVISVFSESASAAGLVLILSVAVYRPLRTTLLVFGVNSISLFFYLQVKKPPESGALAVAVIALYIAVAGWGLYIRSRRQLMQTLRDRADRAETVAKLQAEQGQLRAREEIAREMHDVLGHRLSLLSVHAGALAYRPDASTEEVASAAEVIRASAHQALQDLREVIGVLRAPVGELPQPAFADLPALVEGAQEAGLPVELTLDVAGTLPDHVGRTAYRIVQEGLTNAMKHAPGEPVTIALAGAPGNGLTVEVRNPAPNRRRGEGQGLLGLTERAALVEGRVEYGRTPEGDFRLHAWLPWPA
ncbi:sensor histidine kinase [Kribbella sandramycini]|uniref:histidine kinase n=1 Tax=Kribbella sandramycini TaxID=60450 RepID=A0A7Y4L4L4_9ACTN|nr:histidine kinase [Kribbella sandramycini]MBB6571555.1 signal transduction histidine kinase [Kribbella sandramycini]NOL44203.1 sensor histidine kinase [Kribbella sandramycini]